MWRQVWDEDVSEIYNNVLREFFFILSAGFGIFWLTVFVPSFSLSSSFSNVTPPPSSDTFDVFPKSYLPSKSWIFVFPRDPFPSLCSVQLPHTWDCIQLGVPEPVYQRPRKSNLFNHIIEKRSKYVL